jgi:hypothetical protein
MQLEGDCRGALPATESFAGDNGTAELRPDGTQHALASRRLSRPWTHEELHLGNIEWFAGKLMGYPSEPEAALLRMNR